MDAFVPHLEEVTLGARIRRARLLSLLTLDQLADRLGVSKVAVWNWESDRSRPRLRRLEELSAVLDIPMNALMNGTDAARLDVPAVISECQNRIAAAVGVPADQVEIKIRFGGVQE